MKEPVGGSRFFPAVPILNVISIILLVSIIPAFLKTKVFTLMAATAIIILGNFFVFVNMIIWRNSIRDIPIYCDIMAYFWSIYPQLLYISLMCFSKFVWYMSRPGSAVYLYDNLRKINILDAMILGGAFLILVPSVMSTFAFRYGILEDFGPQSITYYDLKMIFVNFLPMILAVIVSIVFNALTLRNVLISRRKRQDGDATERSNPPILKYLLLTNSSSVLMIFGNGWALYSYTKYYLLQINDHELYPDLFVPISEVMETIHKKFFLTRFMMDVNPDGVIINGGFFVTIPIVGMYFFAFFGLGAEARKMHRENVKWVAHLLGWRQESKEEEGCSAPKQSYGFLQKKIFLGIFKRVLPSNRNRRVPVDPFELPSNTSSQCLEKGVLDVGPNTAGKVGRTDQVLADPPPRRSMHKSPLPPSLPSPSTPIEGGKARRFSAVTPVQDEPPPFLPLSSTVTDGVVPTGLRSLLRPQRKPPLPPPSHHANSIGNGEQSHPQSLALPVPPPAYTPETLSRERQYWV